MLRRLKHAVPSRPRSKEVFDACVALTSGGELEAVHGGHRAHVGYLDGAYLLIVDDNLLCEGEIFEVASMFVTVRHALRDRGQPRVGSHTRLRALSSAETVPAAVVSIKKR